jgi:hypothetical protein
MLQDVEFLDVMRAVEARGQKEMAIHDGVGLDKKLLDFFFRHGHILCSVSFILFVGIQHQTTLSVTLRVPALP